MSIDIVIAKRESEAIRARKQIEREQATKKARRLKRVEREIVATIGAGREHWRRIEAMPTTLPTQERQSKALEIAPVLVDRKVVRKVKTTADLLQERGHLPRHLRGALDTFAAAVATAMGAVTEGNGSSGKMVASYGGDAIGGGFGPREISQRVLDARLLWRSVEREIPQELADVAEQLVSEEVGLLQGRPVPLGRFGEAIRYTGEKQSAAAGAALAMAACAVIHHAIKRGIGSPHRAASTLVMKD